MECDLVMAARIYEGHVSYLFTKDSNWRYDNIEISNIVIRDKHVNFLVNVDPQILNTNNHIGIYLQVDKHHSFYRRPAGNSLMEISLLFPADYSDEMIKSHAFSIEVVPQVNGIPYKSFVFKCIPITIDACGISTYQGNDKYIVTKTTPLVDGDELADFNQVNNITYQISKNGYPPYQTSRYDPSNKGFMFLAGDLGINTYEIQIQYKTVSGYVYSISTKPFKMVFNDYMPLDNPLQLDYFSAYVNDNTRTVTMVLPEVYSGGFGSVYLSNYNTKVFYLRDQFPKLLDFFNENQGFVVKSYELFSKTVYSGAGTEFEKMEATGVSFSQNTDTTINGVGFVISITPNDTKYVYPQTFIMDANHLSFKGVLTITSNTYTVNPYYTIIGEYRLPYAVYNFSIPTPTLKYITKGDTLIYGNKLLINEIYHYFSTSAQPEQLAVYLFKDGKEAFAEFNVKTEGILKNLHNPISMNHLKSLVPDLPVGSHVSYQIQFAFALKLGDSAWVILDESNFNVINVDFYAIEHLELELTYAKDFVNGSYVYETITRDFNLIPEEDQNRLVSKKNSVEIRILADDYIRNSNELDIAVDYTYSDGHHGTMTDVENQKVYVSANFDSVNISGRLTFTSENSGIFFIPVLTDIVAIDFQFRQLQKPIITVENDNVLPLINIDTVESEFDIESSLIVVETDHYTWSKQLTGGDNQIVLYPIDLFEDNHITVTQYTNDNTGLSSEPVEITWHNFTTDKKMAVTNPVIVFFDTTNNKALPFSLDKDPDINTTVSYPNNTTIQEFNSNSPFVIHDNLKEIKTSISFTIIKGLHKYFAVSKDFYDAAYYHNKLLPLVLDYFIDNYSKYLIMVARPDHYSLFGEIIDSSITRSTDNSYTLKITHLATNNIDKLKQIGVVLKNEE